MLQKYKFLLDFLGTYISFSLYLHTTSVVVYKTDLRWKMCVGV